MNKIVAIVGTRPQIIKHAALSYFVQLLNPDFEFKCIHTGQHRDFNISGTFFREFKLRNPDIRIKPGIDNENQRLSQMTEDLCSAIESESPDLVLVYGDTDSTKSGVMAALENQCLIAHVEAGLRSHNTSMREERNRIFADIHSNFLFAPSKTAVNQLEHERVQGEIFLTGDVMYDLFKIMTRLSIDSKIELPGAKEYYYATLHRPYNVDSPNRLTSIMDTINSLNRPVIFSVHPRTRKNMEIWNIQDRHYQNIRFIDPQTYLANINLIRNAHALITDSGGMQKEAYWLKKRCITIRPETEWTETLQGGWNTLVYHDLGTIHYHLDQDLSSYSPDIYGRGDACQKIIEIIENKVLKVT